MKTTESICNHFTLAGLKHLALAGAVALAGVGCGGDPSEFSEDGTYDEAALEELSPEDAVVSTSDNLLGSDACKDVDIFVTNDLFASDCAGSVARIKVLKLEYYSASEGTGLSDARGWFTEELPNTEIAPGVRYRFDPQDLQYAENDRLTHVKLHYKYYRPDFGWSVTLVRQIDITDIPQCRAGQDIEVVLR
jgi:hypothetical protein